MCLGLNNNIPKPIIVLLFTINLLVSTGFTRVFLPLSGCVYYMNLLEKYYIFIYTWV